MSGLDLGFLTLLQVRQRADKPGAIIQKRNMNSTGAVSPVSGLDLGLWPCSGLEVKVDKAPLLARGNC